MIWKGAALDQLDWFKKLAELTGCTDTRVISYHTSKSIKLPVVEISRPGLSMIMRDNFHDIKVSVDSRQPIDHDLWGMATGVTKHDLCSCYFEGFQEDWVYPGFYPGAEKFSLSMHYKEREILPQLIAWLFRKAEGEDPGPEPMHEIIAQEKKLREVHKGCPIITWQGYARPYPAGKKGGWTPRIEYEYVWPKLSSHVYNECDYDTKPPTHYPTPRVWPFLRLSFASGFAEHAEEEFLRILNQVVGDNRKNTTLFRSLGRPTGQSVQITEMRPRLRRLCERLNLTELLRSDDE